MFGHGMARELRESVIARFPRFDPALSNWRDLDVLFDESIRMRILDDADVDLQVITVPSPPLESLFDGEELRQATRLANDSMAELVHGSERLLGTVSVPLCEPVFAVEELRRGVESLKLIGPQIFTSSKGMPLDDPTLEPFWLEVERLGVPAWLHPERKSTQPDYPTERSSRYSLFLVLGWPYETSIAMARLVMSGVLERHPRLRIVAHHAGAMIPFFSGRIAGRYPEGESLGRMEQPATDGALLDGFKRFFVDTAIHGPLSAVMCSYEFFGPDHMVIGTDMPFGPHRGADFCRWGTEIVENMPIPEGDREKIRSATALRLLGMD